MKKFMFIVAAFVAVFVSLGSFNAYAHEDGNRDANGYVVKGPYLTNGGGANWFLNIGGGATTFVGKDVNGWKVSPSVEASVGRWFTPTVGAQVGYFGFQNRIDIGEVGVNEGEGPDATAVFVPRNIPALDDVDGVYGFHYVHGDVLWNMSNALGGYKETRFWDIIPYVTAGVLVNVSEHQVVLDDASAQETDGPVLAKTYSHEIVGGLGVVNDFRLGKVVDLYVKVGAIASRKDRMVDALDGFGFSPAVTAGLTFNLSKKSNFDRFTSVGVRKAEYEALKAAYDALAAREPEVKEVVKEVPVTKEVEVIKVNHIFDPHTVRFNIGSAKLSDTEKAFIKDYVESVKIDEYTVIGSADSKTGSAKRNEELCYSRADAVVKYLETLGKKAIIKTTLDVVDGVPEASRVALICVE